MDRKTIEETLSNIETAQAVTKAMNSVDTNKTIAEFMGYQIADISSITGQPAWVIVGNKERRFAPHEWLQIPHYDKDLNAMNRAEKHLTYQQLKLYSEELKSICTPFYSIIASAKSRAEAFVKVISK